MLTVSNLHQLLDRAPLHAQTVRLTQPPGGLTPARISPTPPTSRPVVTGHGGRWATTMRFYAGPAYVVRDELGYLPLPAEAASARFQVSIRGI